MNDGSDKHTGMLAGDDAAQSSPSLCSEDLFRSGNTVRIEHAGQIYWLRLTRANKLILTK